MEKHVSLAVVKRLPRYYRNLLHLRKQGFLKVSSGKLAEVMDITASQVRQDFYAFGGFGQQGYGYDVEKLITNIANILGIDEKHRLIIIGAGNIGRALAGYQGFAKDNFEVVALFDINVSQPTVADIPLYSMAELDNFVQNNQVDIAVIATQSKVAADIAQKLVSLNIKNIWNFAPIDLGVDEDVIVENISMSESLYVLSYKINQSKKSQEKSDGDN